MEYEISLKKTVRQPTLTMRAVQPVGELPAFFGKAFGGVMQYLQHLGKQPGGMPFGIYYNLDMQALDVEAGFPVLEDLPGKGEIQASEIPAGEYICTVHTGPYDSMEPAYDALTKWARDNGYTPLGIAYEYYLNDPGEDASVEALTEIRFPVRKS